MKPIAFAALAASMFLTFLAGYTLREAEVEKDLVELRQYRNMTAEDKIAAGTKDLFAIPEADGADVSDIMTKVYSEVREGKR